METGSPFQLSSRRRLGAWTAAVIPRGIVHRCCGRVVVRVSRIGHVHTAARVTRSTTRRYGPFARSLAKGMQSPPAAHGPRTGLHGTGGPRTDSHFIRRGWRQRFHNCFVVLDVTVVAAVATPRETLEGAIAKVHGGVHGRARGASLLQGPAGFGKVFHTKGPTLVRGFDKLLGGIARVAGATAHLARSGGFGLLNAIQFVAVLAGNGHIVHGHREGLKVCVHGVHETRLFVAVVMVAVSCLTQQ